LKKKDGIYHNGGKIYQNKEGINPKEVKTGGNLPKGGFVLSLNESLEGIPVSNTYFRSTANKMGCGKGGFTPSRHSNIDFKRQDDLFVLLVLLWCLLIFLHWCLGSVTAIDRNTLLFIQTPGYPNCTFQVMCQYD